MGREVAVRRGARGGREARREAVGQVALQLSHACVGVVPLCLSESQGCVGESVCVCVCMFGLTGQASDRAGSQAAHGQNKRQKGSKLCNNFEKTWQLQWSAKYLNKLLS